MPQYDVINSMTGITVTAGADSSGHNISMTKMWETGKLMVFFNGTMMTDAQARQILASNGCTIDTAYTGTNPDYLDYSITIPADKTPPQMEAIFSAMPGVRSAGMLLYNCPCPI
jgi:hydrogenase maturation factor